MIAATRRHNRPLFVLVGGATGVGKSTVAEGLARRLGIVRVVSTDVIREVLRAALDLDNRPSLAVSTFEAGELKGIREREEATAQVGADGFAAASDAVVAGFQQQVKVVASGIQALMRRALVEATDMIVEGVHLVPGVIDLPHEREAITVPIVVGVEDVDAHQSYHVARSHGTPSRPPERYLNRFDEIRRIQAEVVRRAQEHGVPTVYAKTPDTTIDAALAIINKALTD
ncbi:MAG: zeta toxin family protein [Actinomycetota bacterium]|nr:zeta toxin family protein [Actinomycetota bacterium]